MDKMTNARLDVLEATCETILKRQGILAAMVAAPTYNTTLKLRKLEEMTKALDEWTLRVKDIEEKFKDGK